MLNIIIFSHEHASRQYEKQEILDLLKRKATDEISVRILKGTDYSMGEKIGKWLKGYSHIEVCYLLKLIQTNRELSLVIQAKENEEELV